MAKTVEMTFAIGATLAGSFTGVFGKAGQALSELQKQTSGLQKTSGQIGAYQKMQGSMAQTSEKLNAARMRVKELSQQMRSTNAPTDALKRQFTAANVEANRLQTSLGNQRRKLGELRTALTGAGVDTKNLASEQSRLTAQSQRAAEAQTRLQNAQAQLAETRQRLSWSNIKGELMTAAGLGYSLYKPVSQASDFESAMARVNAVAFSGGNNRTAEQKAANAEAFKALQEQARELGRTTQYTAVQAAQTQENLARAGFSSNEIISAMPGLLSMAAAEGMDLANAADIAASTLRGFNLSADQTNRVADVLAQTSAASNTSIAALGDSMKYVAPVASGLGISVEEVSAMLGVMANAGIKGSQGGTALRAALNRLSKEPKAVAKALGELGIKSRDADGNMRDMTELLTALQGKLKGMGSADQMKYLSNIFGTEAAAGMLAVMNSAVDGTLGQLKLLNYESNGILNEISEHIQIPIENLRAGMENALPAAQHLGISYKDLSVYLGMLAKGGKQGAEVDKALTVAFDRLAQKPAEVQKALKQFNISAFDDKGKLRELPVLMKELSEALMGIEQGKRLNVLEQIFGKNSGETMQALMKGFAAGAEKELNEVADKATGVSKEMADKVNKTMRGAWIQASSAVSDLMLTIGDVLLPTVTSIVTAFRDFTAWIGELAHENPAWTQAIVGTVGALAALKVGIVGIKIGWNLLKMPFQMAKVGFDILHVKALLGAKDLAETGKKAGLFSRAARGISNGAKGIGKAFMWVGKGIGSFFKNMWNMGKSLISGLFSPMGLKILAIAGIIAAVAATAYLIYKNWDKMKEWWNSWTLKDVFAVVKDYAANAWAYVKQKWSDFWEWIGSFSIWDIFAPLKDYAVAAKDYIMEKWESLKSWWNSWSIGDIFAPIKEYASLAGEYVLSKLEAIKEWWDSWTLADVFAPVKQYAADMWAAVMTKWESLKSWWNSWSIGDIFAPVKEYASLAGEYVLSKWEDIQVWWSSWTLADVFTPVKQYAADMWTAVMTKWESLKSWWNSWSIGDVFSGIIPENFSLPEISWETMTAGFETARSLIASGWENLKGAFTLENLSGIWNTLSSGFSEVCDTIKSAWNGVCDFIGNAWNKVAGTVSGAWNWAKGLFGYDVEGEELEAQLQDITALNKMSEGFTQRVAEMTAAWQPFKTSLGEGFEQIYATVQGVADKIRGVTIPAVNELASALSKIAGEINSIVQAGELSVKVETPRSRAMSAVPAQYQRMAGFQAHAAGGIFSTPHLGLVAEAGREAVIPLENQTRGIQLWFEAGRELGLLKNTEQASTTLNILKMQPEINNTAEPQNMFSKILRVVFPKKDLEERAQGLPLWKFAGEETALRFGNSTTSNDNRSSSVIFSPSFYITVNGGEQGIVQKFRQIIEDVLRNMQNDMERVSFA